MPENTGVQYTDPPQSRNEAILADTIDGTSYTDPPQSRMEALLKELNELIIAGGGGGGTIVIANPEETGSEANLEGIQVGSTKYKVANINDTQASEESVYSSQKVDATFATKEIKVDSTLYDYTSLTLTGRSKSKLIYNPHFIKAGQTIKSVTVKHGSNVNYSMTLVVGTISGTTLTPVFTKDFTYGSGASTIVDVNYTANAECVVGLYGEDPCGPPYSTAESGGCMCTKNEDTYTIASTGNSWVGTFKVEVTDAYDAVYANDVSELVGSAAQVTVAQDGSGDVTTISEAVNLVSAERNIIYVKNGTYEEEVNLSSVTFPVWLIGEDRDLTILKSALDRKSVV